MATDVNQTMVRRFIEEVYNQGNFDFVDEVTGPDWVRHGVGGTVPDSSAI